MTDTNIEYENLAKLNSPFLKQFAEAYQKVAESGWYILGNFVKKFEEEFALYNKAPHCIGVASGLDAITLSINAFNFEKGSEIIVPSNTYVATILSVLQNNMKPVLVEPDINTYNINPHKIEECITPKTKAIVVVHLYGKACDMIPIVELCKKYKLKLIEDCAQSHGAKYKNKYTGTFGDFGAFSFYPTKNLGALGDAGAVVCQTPDMDKVIRRLRNYGSNVKYYNEVVGYNSRLDELQAAFLSVKLSHLDEINKHKRKLASVYLENLKNDYVKPVVHPDYFDVYHIFNVRHEKRNELKDYLLKNNIKTEVHYPVSPSKQNALKGLLNKYDFPVSEKIHATTLSLPISYFHTTDDVSRVVEVMNKF